MNGNFLGLSYLCSSNVSRYLSICIYFLALTTKLMGAPLLCVPRSNWLRQVERSGLIVLCKISSNLPIFGLVFLLIFELRVSIGSSLSSSCFLKHDVGGELSDIFHHSLFTDDES